MNFLCDVDLLALTIATPNELQVLSYGRALRLRQGPCAGIRDPAMNTTTAGIDPQEMLVSKILWSE